MGLLVMYARQTQLLPVPSSRCTVGFTLIELVMVILLLSVLAAVAIPNFIDFRTDAKNAATKGALGALRSALSITRAAIVLKEEPSSSPKYPTATELNLNQFTVSHPQLSGVNIMDPSSGVPKNPWTPSSAAAALHNTVIGFDGLGFNTREALYNDDPALPCENNGGWGYLATSGEI